MADEEPPALQAFDDFVHLHQASLVRYAMLLSGSAAQGEDLVQEVLARMYPRWHRMIVRDGNAYAYVRRAITNEYLSWRRRWSTRHIRLASDEELHGVPTDPWQDAHDDELWLRLSALPAQQRAAIALRYYEGLTDVEISEVLGCRQGTTRSHISRGLAALRTSMRMPATGRSSG